MIGFSKHIQPLTEQALIDIEADDVQLKREAPLISRLSPVVFVDLKAELEERYANLEALQQSEQKYDQQEIDKELDALEKLQCRYDKIEARRKKLAKQNYEQVRPSLLDDPICEASLLQISKFVNAYETGLSALKTDVNDRSILATTKEHNDSLTKSNVFQGSPMKCFAKHC